MAESAPDCSALLDEELSSFVFNYLTDSQVRLAGGGGVLKAAAGTSGLWRALSRRRDSEARRGGGRDPGAQGPPRRA